ncbi:putative amino acid/polyamine transporter I, cationic amino acid transporter [Rosa chinensis]|uniref:Putative amino acid/polyamine transporter I, cationic amino acid transporter n=1 Tax=Rosa chinensis TaxID=74649 RepID=A0A2P6Q993_ROSCH|nr:cationic amino acid transporter 8, vacuolar [Rosa chinensis]PRQ30752.1 putative amino acid/polyamine transporter I, cationic amino acid transporter [Rosa chinensis]
MDSQPQPEQQDPEPRSYWKRWTKQDFFPEPTFRNLSSYKDALSHTPSRLKDRLLNRSSDTFELLHLPKQSEHHMHRCLTWWDLIWLGFGSVVGSGIFVITGEATLLAGPAIVLSYAISGLSALLSVLCYTEFAVEVPVAGGSFSYLRIELGDFVAFIAAGNILLEAMVGAAGLGRSWTSYLASMINTDNTDFLRFRVSSLPDGFNLLDPIAVVVLLVANGIAMSGTARTSMLNWIASIASALVILFIIVVGFIYGKTENLRPFFPYGAEGVFKAAAVVYWSYTGFDMVANLAEEVKQPSKDIPVGLIGSMSLITVIYCLMALALVMMQKYTEVSADAAYSVAFTAIGMNWAKYLVSICALKGMTTSLLVGSLGQARYTTQIARSHMISPWFALVHPRTGTPIYATMLVTIASAIVAFFTSLDVLSSVFSFSTLSIFMCVAIALLVRRYYVKDLTAKNDLVKFLASLFVIIGSSIAIAALWNTDVRGWVWYVVAGVIWFSGTLWMALLPKQRVAKVWSVPLVPWVPALSIGINLFLIGSLGYDAFLRFAICTAVMVVYYLFVGVHATYDVAHQIERQESRTEEGSASQRVLL